MVTGITVVFGKKAGSANMREAEWGRPAPEKFPEKFVKMIATSPLRGGEPYAHRMRPQRPPGNAHCGANIHGGG